MELSWELRSTHELSLGVHGCHRAVLGPQGVPMELFWGPRVP